ncbi:MAG: hypothetical protein A3J97_14945 [Spirochaetes bacterium RIFOXYC1_FULL_54_7]|nr:MAG: hypothetical protein A3J97_14945 [Spirochaetes bacterium RIFOXYC1_FULL_54_7]
MNNLVVLLAIQTLVSILLIVWVRLRVMRSLDDGESIARVRREIGAMIVELDGSADRNITVIEDRLHELKVCIAEADKRIVMLSNESARASTPTTSQLPHAYRTAVQAPQPLPESPQSSGQGALPPLPDSQQVVQATQPAVQASQPAVQATRPAVQATRPTVSALPTQAPSVPFIRFSEKPLVFDDSFSERVARLHKRGFSSDIIAAKLKATIAEVDLAIAAGGDPMEGRGEG